MKNIVRLGMFETNSSSMHSIVIKKIDKIPDEGPMYNDFFGGYCGDRLYNRKVWFTDFEHENYCRQGGRILISTEDKLNLYLSLLAYDILYEGGYSSKIDCETFKDKFQKKIDQLNTDFFNNLGVNLKIEPPTMHDVYEKGNYYASVNLPVMEDSDGVFTTLMKKLEDPKNLYSYLYLPESFIFLAGDEYESAYYLKKILQKGVDFSDKEVIGPLKERD